MEEFERRVCEGWIGAGVRVGVWVGRGKGLGRGGGGVLGVGFGVGLVVLVERSGVWGLGRWVLAEEVVVQDLSVFLGEEEDFGGGLGVVFFGGGGWLGFGLPFETFFFFLVEDVVLQFQLVDD